MDCAKHPRPQAARNRSDRRRRLQLAVVMLAAALVVLAGPTFDSSGDVPASSSAPERVGVAAVAVGVPCQVLLWWYRGSGVVTATRPTRACKPPGSRHVRMSGPKHYGRKPQNLERIQRRAALY